MKTYLFKHLLIIGMLSILNKVHAQLMINLQLPPTGLTLKSQLWNFSLINPNSSLLRTKVEVVLQDASNNQRVLSGIGSLISVESAAQQIKYSDVSPVVYTVHNSAYGIDASPEGFLPVGTFIVCYNVIQYEAHNNSNIAQECETISIEPISPPILVLPADSERLEISRPIFTWAPPMPFSLFNNLNYDWILVEVQPLQTAAVAIQQNFPLLTQTGLTASNFQFPIAAPELDTSKLYAWRVTAKNNATAIANSEVWCFRIKKFDRDTSVHKASGYYMRLKKEMDPAYSISDGLVRYEYINELNDSLVSIRLYDLSLANSREILSAGLQVQLKYGQNFLTMDLRSISAIIEKHIYLLTLTNSMGEVWATKFEYRQLVE